MRRMNRMTIGWFLFCSLAMAASARLPDRQAQAQVSTVITVTSQQDRLVVDGACTLREAIESANTGVQFDTCGPGNAGEALPEGVVVLELPPGDYFLTLSGADEDSNQSGDLDLHASMAIRGADAASTRISGVAQDRVFDINPTSVTSISVTLAGLTIDDGQPPGGSDGGGVRAARVLLDIADCVIANNRLTGITGEIDFAHGAGIAFNGGVLNVIDSLITNNRTSFGSGGGIANDAIVNGSSVINIVSSTISVNRAEVTSGTGSGGGILNLGGTVNILSSTIQANFADGQAGGLMNFSSTAVANIANSTITANTTNGSGGGIRNSGQLYLTHVTLSANTADADALQGGAGGGLRNQGVLQIKASIVAGNADRVSDSEAEQHPDLFNTGVFTSTGYVFLGQLTGAPSIIDGVNGDRVGVDPLLERSSGTTTFFALRFGSPALDQVPLAECTFIGSENNPLFSPGAPVLEDQIGNLRPDPATLRCDIGAHEPAFRRLLIPLLQIQAASSTAP